MAPKLDPWIRVFDVSNPVKHEKGYTLYKVTSKVFPRNSPEAVTEIIVWKRYSDFKKLHKMLQTLHAKLYLKGTFPTFAKSRLFGRFDDEVIEERRKSALQLLEFAAQHPPLFTSHVFVKFIEESQSRPNENKVATAKKPKDLQKNINCSKTTPVNSETSSLNNVSEDANLSTEDNLPVLGGIWQHPQGQDSLSPSSDEEYSESDGDSLLNSSVSDLSIFDPLAATEANQRTSSPYEVSNTWLLSNLATQVGEKSVCTNNDNFFNCMPPENLTQDSVDGFSLDASGKSNDKNSALQCANREVSNKEELNINSSDLLTDDDDVFNSCVDYQRSNGKQKENDFVVPNNVKSTQKLKTTDQKNKLSSSYSLPVITPVSFSINDGTGEYLYEAATSISLAQENEANGAFDLAFTHYKAGVATLLTGVQNDNNNARREAVRTKTAQYLMRAEEIYKKYLSVVVQDDNRWGTNSRLSPSFERDLNVGLFQAHCSELQNYRVLGVIDKIQLVLDSATNKTYVMKVLHKSPTASGIEAPSVVPSRIPYMVQLHKFIENDYAIFLILQHAVGGKLCSYIKNFLQNSPHSPSQEMQGCDPMVIHMNQTPTTAGNVYSGKNLIEAAHEKSNVVSNFDENSFEKKLKDSKDLDLIAETECSSSYTQLFTTYAASLQPDKHVGLAKCNVQYQENTDSSSAEDLPIADNVHKRHLSCDEESSDNTSDLLLAKTESPSLNDIPASETLNDNENRTLYCDLNNVNSIENLEHLDAQDLINCSQKLLNNVTQTLRESYDVKIKQASPNAKPDQSDEPGDSCNQFSKNLPYQETKSVANSNSKSEMPLSSSRRARQGSCDSITQEKYKSHRKYSEESVFTSPIHEGRLSSSAGSVNSKPRLRHLSVVFQQLDQQSETNYLPESCIRVWAAEMVIAISNLHKLGIICRDLRPENILLGERGHILLSYFSQWSCVEKPFNLEASENLYSAPEVNGFSPVTPASDWWSLGALLFELLTSKTLSSCHPGGITSHTPLNIPGNVSLEGQLLLKQLLKYNVNERLGSPPNGVEAIKRHPFFNGFDWDQHSSKS